MIRLKDTRHSSTASLLSSAIKIAEFYGFSSLDEMQRPPQTALTRERKAVKNETEITFARKDERSLPVSARKCIALTHDTHALLGWRISNNATTGTSLELHVMGTQSAIAEALLIVVAHAVIEDAGIKQRVLSINNMGSFESSNRFVRDVGAYLRKHIESITPTLRPRAAEDPLGTLIQLIEKGHPATPRAPQPMEYLTEEERRRFWELLEYLEVFGLQYELNPHVLGSRDCWSHSLFEISGVDEETGNRVSAAIGGRYDPLATRFAGRAMPAVTISITTEVRGGTHPKRETRGFPSIYFAHLGGEARRKSLSVMEMLRAADIPVYQGLCFDRIGEQMQLAKELATPYILIMGHKEAMEGTILVREVATNSQDAVTIPELSNYLKRHRLGTWRIGAKNQA